MTPNLIKAKYTNRFGESLILTCLQAFSYISILTTIGIVAILALESSEFFKNISLQEFLFTTEWAPLFEPRRFGILPLIMGTLLVAGLSCLVSVPLGIAVALYLSQYATERARSLFKPLLEILAGIPSVVFGYFAMTAITPFIRSWYPEAEVFNALSAAIVVGIMTLPLVASLSDDAMRSVPSSLLEGGYALGTTKAEVNFFILLPAASSGIIASFVLAFSRAIGETMAVTLAAGSTPNLTLNPFESIQTMAAYIVQVSMGDTPRGSIEYQSIFAVGLVLFLITLFANMLASFMKQYFKKGYV